MGGGLFAYATSAGRGCASRTAAQQTLFSRRRGNVAVVVAAAAGWDEEAVAAAAAEREAERAAVGRPPLAGRPRELRQGPEEVALGGNCAREPARPPWVGAHGSYCLLQGDLELAVRLRLALNVRSFCLSF